MVFLASPRNGLGLFGNLTERQRLGPTQHGPLIWGKVTQPLSLQCVQNHAMSGHTSSKALIR